MTSRAARAAAVYGTLTASHELADYWGQPDALACAKGHPGPAGATACAGHVASLGFARSAGQARLNPCW